MIKKKKRKEKEKKKRKKSSKRYKKEKRTINKLLSQKKRKKKENNIHEQRNISLVIRTMSKNNTKSKRIVHVDHITCGSPKDPFSLPQSVYRKLGL